MPRSPSSITASTTSPRSVEVRFGDREPRIYKIKPGLFCRVDIHPAPRARRWSSRARRCWAATARAMRSSPRTAAPRRSRCRRAISTANASRSPQQRAGRHALLTGPQPVAARRRHGGHGRERGSKPEPTTPKRRASSAMWISDLSIRRPVLAIMVIGALVALGWVSLQRIGVDLFPRVEFPYVNVMTVLEGASPDAIETDITDTSKPRSTRSPASSRCPRRVPRASRRSSSNSA